VIRLGVYWQLHGKAAQQVFVALMQLAVVELLHSKLGYCCCNSGRVAQQAWSCSMGCDHNAAIMRMQAPTGVRHLQGFAQSQVVSSIACN